VPADRRAQVDELVGFALERLPSMQLSDGSFCHEVVRGGPEPRGRSLRYTLIVLLGLLRARAAGMTTPVDPTELRNLVLGELDSLGAAEHGLLLWAEARSGGAETDRVVAGLRSSVEAEGEWAALEGLAIAWAATGLTEAAAASPGQGLEAHRDAALAQLRRNQAGSGLLGHHGTGWRARFPNFATQIYGVQALAIAARRLGDEGALRAPQTLADRLLELQRANGGWPWLFDARRGAVVEPFEVYATHQDGMAPMALTELSEATGEPRYREAALRGLDWIWGRNELETPMLDRAERMLYRSIVRRPALDRIVLYANTLGSYAGRPPFARANGPLVVNATDRPYHLGWILEAWCGREPAKSTTRS
jgi:hypothetical protein